VLKVLLLLLLLSEHKGYLHRCRNTVTIHYPTLYNHCYQIKIFSKQLSSITKLIHI